MPCWKVSTFTKSSRSSFYICRSTKLDSVICIRVVYNLIEYSDGHTITRRTIELVINVEIYAINRSNRVAIGITVMNIRDASNDVLSK